MLVGVLGKLEETCEKVGGFWTEQAENFSSQGAKMATNQVKMIKQMRGVVSKNNTAFWTKAKSDMDHYVNAMSVVNDRFKLVTEATPPAAKSLTFSSIKLILHVPTKALSEVVQL